MQRIPKKLQRAPGIRERAPDVWELIVQAGRDPVTGDWRQVSRTFHGTLSQAKKARAQLLVEATGGRHTGARATMDDLYVDWVLELERKGRSPNTVRGYRSTYEHNRSRSSVHMMMWRSASSSRRIRSRSEMG